jgi:hypothetical protein
MGIVFVVIFLAVGTTIAAVKGYRRWRKTNFLGKVAICFIAVGLLGFFEPFWIHLFPRELLDHFELPITLWADRLTAPDGRVFIVSFLRVQRYGPEGFEKGFMVGRNSRSAMSASGNVLICSPGGELRTYTPDSGELPPRGTCRHRFEGAAYFYYHSDAKVPAIAFNWFSAVAVPLWHPVVGWVIGLFWQLAFQSFFRVRAPESNPGARGPTPARCAGSWPVRAWRGDGEGDSSSPAPTM